MQMAHITSTGLTSSKLGNYAHQTHETKGKHIIPVGITAVQLPHYSISHHSQTQYILILLAPRHFSATVFFLSELRGRLSMIQA